MKIYHLIVALGLGLGLILSIPLVLADNGLEIDKSVYPESIDAGESVTYTIQLYTGGDEDVPGVTLTDTLPVSTTFSRWFTKPSTGVITAGNAITWTGTVTAGEMIKLIFVVTHTGSTGDVITNTAHYSTSGGSGSDDADFTVGYVSNSKLTIIKSHLPLTIYEGDFVTYTIALRNSGDSTSVTLTDTLPLSTTFERLLAGSEDIITSSQAITWIGEIPAEGEFEWSFVVSQTGSAGDIIANTAYFSETNGAGSNETVFTVSSSLTPFNKVYLPLIFKN